MAMEYAAQCLFTRNGVSVVKFDANSTEVSRFFEKIKKSGAEFQASVFLTKHFFRFKTSLPESPRTLASFTNSLCNFLLLVYLVKLLSDL